MYLLSFTDVLIIANEYVKGLHYPEADYMFLKDHMGLTDVKTKFEQGEFLAREPKVLVLITGREEAVERHPALLNVVRNTVQVIRKVLPNTIMLLCAPPPMVKDRPYSLAKLDGLAGVLQRECRESEYLEFSRLGTHFYGTKLVHSRGGTKKKFFC